MDIGEKIEKSIRIHEHDCEDCVFLGNYVTEKGLAGDLYIHIPESEEFWHRLTVIFRYGKDGDYESGICFNSPPLLEAKIRAITLGILNSEDAQLPQGEDNVRHV